MNGIVPNSLKVAQVDDLVASADYATAELCLFENDFDPDVDTVLADLVAATFSGYAPVAVTWGGAYIDPEGDAISSGGEVPFAQTGATGANIYGAYLTNAANNKLLWAARFDEPYPMVADGDVCPVLVRQGLLFGSAIIAPT